MSAAGSFLHLARLLPDPMLLVTGDGDVLAASRGAEALLGAPLAGRSLRDFVAPGETGFQDHLKSCLRSGSLLPATFRFCSADGSPRDLRADGARFQPSPDEPPGVLLRMRAKEVALARFGLLDRQIERLNEEIRERRRAEREVLELNARLEERVRERTAELEKANVELDAFAAAVSHDLRAPLRAIVSASRMLAEDAGERLTEEEMVVLTRQGDAAMRMARMTEALLRIARASRVEIKKQDLDVTRLAEQTVEAVAPAYAACGTAFHVHRGMRALADPDLLGFALENLVANACKFSCPVSSPRVEVGQDGAAYFVRDNGVGFDPEKAKDLFEPFQRIHDAREFEGTGVGLSNVRRIVDRHGGRIWAESRPGEGATFFFTL